METKPWVEFLQRENLLARRRCRLPVCDGCGEPIDSETYVGLAGCRYCESCIACNTFYTQEEGDV